MIQGNGSYFGINLQIGMIVVIEAKKAAAIDAFTIFLIVVAC